MKTTSLFITGMLTLAVASASVAQQTGARESRSSQTIGKESATEFANQNKQGAAAVSAIKPTSGALSSTDQSLMTEVANGGMMQLAISQVAVQKATNPEVKQLAQAEVEEQTGLAAKLKEIAAAKGFTLPSTPDAKTQEMVSKLQGASGADFDKMYVQESGVKNHEVLDQTMSKVESNATDASLKGIAQAAHPLIKTHLTVSRDVLAKLGNGAGNSGR